MIKKNIYGAVDNRTGLTFTEHSGTGGRGKFVSLKDFFAQLNHSLILIQETMAEVDQTIIFFCAMFLPWHMVAKDVFRRSGGLAVLWDLRWDVLKDFSFFAGIIMTNSLRGFNHRVHVVNIYAPYLEKANFFRQMEFCGILTLDRSILVGDFSYTW